MIEQANPLAHKQSQAIFVNFRFRFRTRLIGETVSPECFSDKVAAPPVTLYSSHAVCLANGSEFFDNSRGREWRSDNAKGIQNRNFTFAVTNRQHHRILSGSTAWIDE